EGAHCLDVDQPLLSTDDCPTTGPSGEPLVDPVVEYSHRQVGIAVVGGYVYRGSAVPALARRYVFADLSRDWTGNIPVPRGSLPTRSTPSACRGHGTGWRSPASRFSTSSSAAWARTAQASSTS